MVRDNVVCDKVVCVCARACACVRACVCVCERGCVAKTVCNKDVCEIWCVTKSCVCVTKLGVTKMCVEDVV